MKASCTASNVRELQALDSRVRLNVSINDLRMIVNCFRTMEHLMKQEAEPYLDAEGLSLKERLEQSYRIAIKNATR